jgi:peptide-methionine (R)-S-oxide reductase
VASRRLFATKPKSELTEEALEKRLSPLAYEVMRAKGTERPFTGALYKQNESGDYLCAACDNLLFKSEHKFDSGCGWPSFYENAQPGAVRFEEDRSYGMKRIEVLCGNTDCNSHLGHIFPDGYGTPTGKRYCINSVAMNFKKRNES